MKIPKFFFTGIAGLFMILTLCACGLDDFGSDEAFLVRAGKSRISVLEFQDAMEIHRSAYPHRGAFQQMQLSAARKRLLDQVIEELLLLERAREMGLEVSAVELETAINTFKKDYPDTVFEQMLIENAVSFEVWKEGVRKRLIMEKVIQVDLEQHLAITPEDVSAYYQRIRRGRADTKERSETVSEPSSEKAVRMIRREKLEKAYPPYLDSLKKRYTIEVNQALWHKINNP